MNIEAIISRAYDLAWSYGTRLLMALLLLVVGWWVIRRVVRAMRRILSLRNIDPSLRPFLTSLVDIGLKVVLLLMVAGTIGFQTTSFLALFSAIALSVGLALQGSLGNFASGVLILLFRPFRVGDMITAVGQTGIIDEIQIFSTVLRTDDGRRVIIPNGRLTNEVVVNAAGESAVRVETTVIRHDSIELDGVREAARSAARECIRAATDRDVFVEARGYPGEGGVKAVVGIWTTGEHYWETYHTLRASLKKAFDAAGIRVTIEG